MLFTSAAAHAEREVDRWCLCALCTDDTVPKASPEAAGDGCNHEARLNQNRTDRA